MRLAMPRGPRASCKILAVIGLAAMALPWIFPIHPLLSAILFDGGSIAGLVGLLLLLSDSGGAS